MPSPSACVDGKWTDYFNIDNPSNDGDFETLSDLRRLHSDQLCTNPTAVDARLAINKKDYRLAGQVIHMNTTIGFICMNREQTNRRGCLDYQVRFCCPKRSNLLGR